MSKIKPHIIANWLVESGTNENYIILDKIIYLIIDENIPSMSDESIWDYIEENINYIADELFTKIDDYQEDGINPNFDLYSDDETYYIRFYKREEIPLLRKLRSESPDFFEYFCKDILTNLGANADVTGGPHDGGVDFIGYDLKINNLPFESTIGSNILVIGQSKRYKDGNHVTEKELREFVGASIKRIDEIKKTRSDQVGILHPIIIAFWTTSDFHTNAKDFARSMGIWYLNGIALSQLAIKLGMKIE